MILKLEVLYKNKVLVLTRRKDMDSDKVRIKKHA